MFSVSVKPTCTKPADPEMGHTDFRTLIALGSPCFFILLEELSFVLNCRVFKGPLKVKQGFLKGSLIRTYSKVFFLPDYVFYPRRQMSLNPPLISKEINKKF